NPMVFAKPDVEAVAGKIGDVAGESFGLAAEGFAAEDPAHMSPPSTFMRCVGISIVVGELVMDAMHRYPEYGTAFEGERGANGHGVFKPFGNAIAAVREQAVVAHADTDAVGQIPEHECAGEGLPREHEQRDDGPDMEQPHKDDGDPAE